MHFVQSGNLKVLYCTIDHEEILLRLHAKGKREHELTVEESKLIHYTRPFLAICPDSSPVL